MEKNKVIARFKDGTLLKGYTDDFFPNKKNFHLKPLNGETVNIETELLKALFFVKDFEGNKDHKESYTDAVPGGGRKIQIKFKDGEEVIGYSQGFSRDRPGFFVIPADTQSNNERFFVVMSATEKLTFL
jgi:hypothetical protein